MSYINETDFVIENKELVYPEIVTDGLQLYYDAKGKRDTDYHRDTMLDMSGNKNHGKLHNFSYEKHSGYKDGLVFDYIDDKLVRPALNLQPDDLTFMLNGNIISFSPDGTVKRVQDGEVVEAKGVNLIRNGDFVDGSKGWLFSADVSYYTSQNELIVTQLSPINREVYIHMKFEKNHVYYISLDMKSISNSDEIRFLAISPNPLASHSGSGEYEHLSMLIEAYDTIDYSPELRALASGREGDISDNPTYIKNVIQIDLTEAFGTGNEPTKEEMDEIINRFGFIPNPQDLIDRIEYKGNDLGDMENIIDGLYKTEVLSGEEIFTDKADDDAVVHVEVDGKSVGGGSGENMFNKYFLSDRNNFQLATYSSSSAIQLKPNTTYVLSASRVNPSPDGNQLVLNIMDATGGIPVYGSPDYHSTRIKAVFNMLASHSGFDDFEAVFITPESGLIFYSYYDNKVGKSSEGNWFTDVMIDAKLEEGSVVTEYEPPAPTPDYPIEIKSLNDFDVVSSVGKENLLPTSFSSYAMETYGYVKLVDEETPLIFKLYEKDNSVDMSRIYFGFSKIGASSNGGVLWAYADGDRSPSLNSESEMKAANYKYFSFFPNNEVTFNKIFKRYDIKIEKGTVATPYSLAPEDITENSNHPLIDKINLLLDEPLRSIGDTKDRLFRDSDGLWKVERNIKKTILPSSNWKSAGTQFDNTYTVYQNFSDMTRTDSEDVQYIMSDRFKFDNNEAYKTLDVEMVTHNGYSSNIIIVRINKSRLTSVNAEGFQDWSINNPTTVQYILAVAEIEVLPQSLQDKLYNLRSFEESNYVYTIDGNTNLLDTVTLLNNHWYPHVGIQQNPEAKLGQTATKDAIAVYPGTKIRLAKINAGDNYWRIVWVDKDNNVVLRETPTDNDLILTTPDGAYGMRVSYSNGAEPVIEFDKSNISSFLSENLKPTIRAKFLYNDWYKKNRVINNLMIYNRALNDEEMLQNYKMIKRRWGM